MNTKLEIVNITKMQDRNIVIILQITNLQKSRNYVSTMNTALEIVNITKNTTQ